MLCISRLAKNYGGVRALDNVSLTVSRGSVLGLVGDNGAGKSTLLKCITGAEYPDEGAISFCGRQLPAGDPHATRAAGIEMIYQDLNLCAQQSVAENIFLGRELSLRIAGIDLPFLDQRQMRTSAKELLSRLNAAIDVQKPVGALSGGQQQAVAIARALTFKPQLLIMDEPTAALGVRESLRVLELISTLKSEGMAVILVSHRLTDVMAVCDSIAVMRHGRLHCQVDREGTSLASLTEMILSGGE